MFSYSTLPRSTGQSGLDRSQPLNVQCPFLFVRRNTLLIIEKDRDTRVPFLQVPHE